MAGMVVMRCDGMVVGWYGGVMAWWCDGMGAGMVVGWHGAMVR